ncbi:hypothetical protein WN51_11434 [Melipona quadrifasciata]|uniref:Uncharacterized protein n=1 Tax=Melipona quadrifasciata TaxID=166423 RepID=A0A0M9ABF1_9HYME|nr:hypothetical protein WN51_11434 [Melipona quadrifasciata]
MEMFDVHCCDEVFGQGSEVIAVNRVLSSNKRTTNASVAVVGRSIPKSSNGSLNFGKLAALLAAEWGTPRSIVIRGYYLDSDATTVNPMNQMLVKSNLEP